MQFQHTHKKQILIFFINCTSCMLYSLGLKGRTAWTAITWIVTFYASRSCQKEEKGRRREVRWGGREEEKKADTLFSMSSEIVKSIHGTPLPMILCFPILFLISYNLSQRISCIWGYIEMSNMTPCPILKRLLNYYLLIYKLLCSWQNIVILSLYLSLSL